MINGVVYMMQVKISKVKITQIGLSGAGITIVIFGFVVLANIVLIPLPFNEVSILLTIFGVLNLVGGFYCWSYGWLEYEGVPT